MIEKVLAGHDDFFVYLSSSPLTWLTLTLVAYVIADGISLRFGRHPALNLVALAAAMIIAALKLTGTSYETFFAGAQFIHFLLGPATVALAIPLYRNVDKVRAAALPILASLAAGSLAAIFSVVWIARALGGSIQLAASLAPKSVTSPIAMGLSEKIGGLPVLTAALVIATGVIGALILSPLMRLLRMRDSQAIGMAAELAAHGIGAARAFHIDSVAGAFAGIAMGLNGAFTSVILPLLRPLLGI